LIALTTLKLELPQVRNIGNYFCAYINVDDLAFNFPLLSNVGSNAFNNCDQLETLTLIWPNIKHIADYFCNYCPSIRTLTLNIRLVTHIGRNFLSNCQSLINVILDCPAIERVNELFCVQCPNLKFIYVRENVIPVFLAQNRDIEPKIQVLRSIRDKLD